MFQCLSAAEVKTEAGLNRSSSLTVPLFRFTSKTNYSQINPRVLPVAGEGAADGHRLTEMWRQQVQQRLEAVEGISESVRRTADKEQEGLQRNHREADLNPTTQLSSTEVLKDVQLVLIKEECPEEWRPDVNQQDTEPPNIQEEEDDQLRGRKTDASRITSTAAPLPEFLEGVQMVLIKEEEEEWRPGVDQQDPETPNIKEEEEEQQLGGMKTHVTRISCTAVPFERKTGKAKPLFSQLHQHPFEHRGLSTSSSADQMKAAASGKDCGGARNPDLNPHGDDFNSSETEVSEEDEADCNGNKFDSQLEFLSNSEKKTEDSSKNWKENRSSGTGVNTINKPFSCSECGKQFLHKRSLQRHVTSHSGIGSSNVDSYRKVHTEQKSFNCDECGKIFNRKSNLNTHIRTHTGQKPFVCDVCGQRFSQKPSLNTHTRIHTGHNLFDCGVCGQTFNQKITLNTHMRTHTGQKPFACDVCGQRFSQKTNLNTHMRIHTGEKPFACDLCGQRFSQKTNLKAHMRIHTGEKQFECDFCGLRFSHKTTLNTHLRLHTGQKPFACDVCGQRFSQKTHLNTHMRTHTGEKPFSCDVCGQRFSQQTILNTHMRTHTGQKPYACDFCGQRFSHKTCLNRHIIIHTGPKPLT